MKNKKSLKFAFISCLITLALIIIVPLIFSKLLTKHRYLGTSISLIAFITYSMAKINAYKKDSKCRIGRALSAIMLCVIALLVMIIAPIAFEDFLISNRYFAVLLAFVVFFIVGYSMICANMQPNEVYCRINETNTTKTTNAIDNTKTVVENKVEKVQEETEDDDEENESFIRMDYSFKSKLILSSDEVKEYYNEIVSFASSYGVKIRKSWKKETIYLGRNPFAVLSFKGKKLSVAFALNPAFYENSKYHFVNVSEVKKFEKTPLLMKITSNRKVKYTKELLNIIFNNNGLVDKKLDVKIENIPTSTKEKLIEEGLIKDPSKVNA